MSELTREYLDKKLDKLATKQDVVRLETKIEKEVEKLETKIETEVAELARITKNGFDEIKKELDVRKQVESRSLRIYQIERALNIKH